MPPSVAVAVTVVVPRLKLEPEAGLYPILTPGQLSLAVAAKVTFADVAFGADCCVMFAGQVIVGG